MSSPVAPALETAEERILDGVDDPEVKAFTLLEPVLTEAVSSKVAAPDAP